MVYLPDCDATFVVMPGRIGDHSFDELAGALDAMFDFTASTGPPLILNPVSGNPG